MAANIIDSLLIQLGIDGKQIGPGLRQIDQQINTGVKSILRTLAPLGGALGAGAIINDYARSAEAIGKLSNRLGVEIRELGAWSLAAQEAGGSAEAFQNSILSLNQRLTEASLLGRKTAQDVFDQLGVRTRDANGKLRAATDIFLDLSEAAEGFDNATFSSLATRIGLDAGTIHLLQSGRQEVERLVAAQRDLTYTEEDYRNAQRFNDGLSRNRREYQLLAAVILRRVLPVLSRLTESNSKFVNFLRRHEPFLMAFLTGLALVVSTRLVPAFAAWSAAILANPLTWLIAGIAVLALLFDDLWTFINGGEAALKDFWAALGFGEDTLERIGNAWQRLEDLWGEVIGIFGGQKAEIDEATDSLGRFENAAKLVAESIRGIIEIAAVGIAKLREFGDAWGGANGTNDKEVASTGSGFNFKEIAAGVWEFANPVRHLENLAYLGNSAINAVRGAVTNTEVNIQNIEIITQSTDPDGIASDFGDGVSRRLALVADRGVNE